MYYNAAALKHASLSPLKHMLHPSPHSDEPLAKLDSIPASIRSLCAVLSSAASPILHLGREYIQLAIIVVLRVFSTLMAPFMSKLLRYAFCSISTDILSVSLPATSKPKGKMLSFVHGFGSHIFSWVLRSEPSLSSGTFSSRSVIGDIY
jgi:hypothetical protein